MSNGSFEAKEQAKPLMLTVRKAWEDVAFAQAAEFIDAGQSTREATSMVAILLIQTAWIVAASGALSDGVEPDKDKFRSCVETALDIIEFKERDAA